MIGGIRAPAGLRSGTFHGSSMVASPQVITLALAMLQIPVVHACASCGCTLSPDAAMGYSASSGWRLGLEYDYIPQTQLRSGTHEVRTVPDGFELEHDTLNSYVTGSLAYAPDSRWNFNLLVPYVIRTHSTYGGLDSDQPLPPLSNSRSSSLGDVRLLGSYQGFLPTRNLGLQLGVKLPTGHYGNAVGFDSGPAAGTPLDASLQPGTGSTDAIVGAYYYRPVSQDFDLFINGQFQSAVKHHLDQFGADYRPGNSTMLAFGLRYAGSPLWIPQLQVNFLRKARDQGALADVENTAGEVVYLSPGLAVHALPRTQLFGFLQVPVYSNLYGYQLFPRYTLSVGVSYAL